MVALSTPAPDFSLPDVVSGKTISLATFKEKRLLLVMFICRPCPYVQHVKSELARLGRDYSKKDVGIVAISANDAQNYPEDAPAKLREMAQDMRYAFPVLHDEIQEVAKAYGATCTPDFFLFDAKRRLIYRGQLDDSRPGNGKPLTGRDLRTALDAVLLDRPVSKDQKPSVGCNIKWKAGRGPSFHE